MFGNEGWLQIFQIRQLRMQQEREQHKRQYMPPVDEIRKLNVDPFTIRVESDDPDGDEDGDDEEERKEETVATKKPLAWKIRRPER